MKIKPRWLLLALFVLAILLSLLPVHHVERLGRKSVCTGDCKADLECYDSCHKRGWCEFSTEQANSTGN